jgi:hypothetical protein
MANQRNAAIIGPTPETLYWCLGQPCRLRTLAPQQVAENCFRALRPLRELSSAILEERVIDGFALDRSAFDPDDTSAELWGFPVAEILQAYGGQAQIESCCQGCPANQVSGGQGWAGCFGLVPLWENEQFSWRDSIVQIADQVITDRGLTDRFYHCFAHTRPAWYGMWINERLSLEQCAVARDTIREILARLKLIACPAQDVRGAEFGSHQGLVELLNGLTAAVNHSLELHVGYAVAGVSDGTFWRLSAHCGRCHFPTNSDQCPCCGASGTKIEARKRRVLGRRPYLRLSQIVGPSLAELLAENAKRRR